MSGKKDRRTGVITRILVRSDEIVSILFILDIIILKYPTLRLKVNPYDNHSTAGAVKPQMCSAQIIEIRLQHLPSPYRICLSAAMETAVSACNSSSSLEPMVSKRKCGVVSRMLEAPHSP